MVRVGKGVVLTGYRHTGFSLPNSAQWLLKHCGILPQIKQNRNEIIRNRFHSGETMSDLAEIGIDLVQMQSDIDPLSLATLILTSAEMLSLRQLPSKQQ